MQSSDQHCHITDAQGRVVHSTIEPQCLDCIKSCTVIQELVSACGIAGKHRRGTRNTIDGKVFLCSNSHAHIGSAKLFKKELDFFTDMLVRLISIEVEIAQQGVEKINRLLHNLTSLNAHSIQELYALIPQHELATVKSFRDQQKIVARKLESAPSSAASAFLRILKNEMSLKNEFSVYRKLNDPNPLLQFSTHQIHRVILHAVNLFFQSFADKQVNLTIQPTDVRINIDYESIQVAFYHLMDNAAKYCKEKTDIQISFDQYDDDFWITIDMISLHSSLDEKDKIHLNGFSGDMAKRGGTAGKGLGMGLVKELLRLNAATIDSIMGTPLVSERRVVGGLIYANNKFIVKFPNTSIVSSDGSTYKRLAPTRLNTIRSVQKF